MHWLDVYGTDSLTLRHLLSKAVRKTHVPPSSHSVLYADKGYDSGTCRTCVRQHNLIPLIPKRGTPTIWGGIRIAVEIAIGCIDKFRRLILRYDASIGCLEDKCHRIRIRPNSNGSSTRAAHSSYRPGSTLYDSGVFTRRRHF